MQTSMLYYYTLSDCFLFLMAIWWHVHHVDDDSLCLCLRVCALSSLIKNARPAEIIAPVVSDLNKHCRLQMMTNMLLKRTAAHANALK